MLKESTNKPNYIIFTGGPGSGKTAILNNLACRGFLTVSETARDIIQKQNGSGGNATHQGDRKLFRDLMWEASIADYGRMQAEEGVVFFDRGMPDLYGYSKAFCGEMNPHLLHAITQFRYNQTVFIFPPWQEIYEQDEERKQDFQEAIFTYNIIKEAYSHCDYHLVEVPKLSINKRIDFILEMVNKSCLTHLNKRIP